MTRRVRWPLLVLLWTWAACVFLVVDLFWTVPEFDAVRPRASLYRGMRVAAHRMVGEPLPDQAAAPPRAPSGPLQPGDSPDALLAARPHVPAGRAAAYAVAVATAAARTPGRREELARVALLELCRGEIDWAAVAGVCHRLARVVPGFADNPRNALALARLRLALERDLVQERALAAAVLLATTETAARARALLPTLPLDERPARWLHASRTVLRHGDARDRATLARWAAEKRSRTDDADLEHRLAWVEREARRP